MKSTVDIPLPLIDALRAARYVAVLTGAGISAESGIPTFRGAQTGLWAQYNPLDLATPEAFRRNPRLVWDWYTSRREAAARAEPNPGHLALAEMERRVPRFILITQNVDGLHQRAGSRAVIELHGSLMRFKCFQEDAPVQEWADTGDVPPRCPRCGGLVRPAVVWFGEKLPPQARQAAIEAAQQCDVFFSIGTSGLVEPAASLPYEALLHGATVIEVNPDSTPLTADATFVLRGPAGQVLPRLVQTVWA